MVYLISLFHQGITIQIIPSFCKASCFFFVFDLFLCFVCLNVFWLLFFNTLLLANIPDKIFRSVLRPT